jgi:hypothetical protein
MKTLLLFFAFIGIVAAQQSEDPEFDALYTTLTLNEKIDRLSDYVDRSDIEQRNKYMKLLSYHLAGNYSVKWQGNPDGLIDLRNQMEKIRPLVRKLAASENFDERSNAVDFMRYLKIDQEVEKMTYAILDKDATKDGRRNAWDAIDLLFAYGLETPELRQRLVTGLIDPVTRDKYPYTDGAELYLGKWRLSEAADNLFLKTLDYYKKNGHVRCAALTSLKDLGYSARSVLPQIKTLLEERQKDPKADFREIELIQYTIITMEKNPSLSGPKHSHSNDSSASTDDAIDQDKDQGFSKFKMAALFCILFVVLAALAWWFYHNHRR